MVDSSLALRACSCVVHGHTIGEFMDVEVERDMCVLEFWAGVSSIAREARAQGLNSAAVELSAGGVLNNLLGPEGFSHAVGLVLRLRPGGLLWMAPVCSSFVWLSSSHTKRCAENEYRGDQTNHDVREGNLGAEVAAFLFTLAWVRSAQPCIENPPGSSMWKYPAIQAMLSTLPHLHFALAHRCVFDSAEYGEMNLKQYKFLASGPWITSPALTAN